VTVVSSSSRQVVVTVMGAWVGGLVVKVISVALLIHTADPLTSTSSSKSSSCISQEKGARRMWSDAMRFARRPKKDAMGEWKAPNLPS